MPKTFTLVSSDHSTSQNHLNVLTLRLACTCALQVPEDSIIAQVRSDIVVLELFLDQRR